VAGPSRLRDVLTSSPDIRTGMAMLLAAVCAKGTSTINNADQIERGCERMCFYETAVDTGFVRLSGQTASDPPSVRTARPSAQAAAYNFLMPVIFLQAPA
jgi:hypothetical protein